MILSALADLAGLRPGPPRRAMAPETRSQRVEAAVVMPFAPHDNADRRARDSQGLSRRPRASLSSGMREGDPGCPPREACETERDDTRCGKPCGRRLVTQKL